MTIHQKIADDEIDLFQLFSTIWRGKWLIIGLMVVFLVVGFAYTQTKPPSYQVSASYQVNLYPLFSQQFCESNSNLNCLVAGTMREALNLFEPSWQVQWQGKAKKIEFTVANPLSAAAYSEHFSVLALALTKRFKQQAEQELSFINANTNTNFQSSTPVAINILNANRNLAAIDKGMLAIEFAPPLVKSTSKTTLVLCLALLLGAMLGVCLVLIRHAYRDYKQQDSEQG